MEKYKDSDYAIAMNHCSGYDLNEKKEVDSSGKEYRIVNGSVETIYGYVKVSTAWSGSDKVYNISCLQFIKDSRVYTRYFKKNYSAQFLVTKAKEFAEELSNK